MRPVFKLSVPGANPHSVALHRLEALQFHVADLGAVHYPLFLRAGGAVPLRLQPVTARALLAEVERFRRELREIGIPGMHFEDPEGNDLGVVFIRADSKPVAASESTQLFVDENGIRIVVRQVPPPAGFRSAPALPAGQYECYFESLESASPGWLGARTEAMSGSRAPVRLGLIPLPPVTKWDYSRVAGAPTVGRVKFVLTPAPEAFRDVIHAFESACTDSLRLKHPLSLQTE